MQWLARVQDDFARLGGRRSLEEAVEGLDAPLGRDVMTKVARRLGIGNRTSIVPTARQYIIGPLGDLVHRRTVPWPIVPQLHKLSVSATVHRKEHGKKLWALGGGIVPKNVWIKFTLKTDVPSPYETRWQVINTGKEAAAERQLRGDFYSSGINSNNTRWEHTKYNGTHWVEAFVIQNGVCVARSGPVYVKVGSYL